MVQTLGECINKNKVEDINNLEKVKKYLNNTLKYVRNLSKGLNLSFGETGLKFALQELTEQMQEFNSCGSCLFFYGFLGFGKTKHYPGSLRLNSISPRRGK